MVDCRAGKGGAVRISREELYRRVWEKPVTHIAKEFDISDVGLAKTCRKYAIPLPPVGYWTKLKYDKAGSRPLLPKLSVAGEIEIDARRHRVLPPQRPPTELPLVAVTPHAELAVENLGPFAAATRKKLLGIKPDGSGFLYCSGPNVLDCRLSAGAIDRTVSLLDAVEKALPLVNAKLVKGEKYLEVEHDGQRVRFRAIEQYSRTEEVVHDKHYKGSTGTEYSCTFTGKLSLEITGYFQGRKRWTDGVRASLSEKLREFVQGLVDAAQAMKQRELEFEAQRLKWAEAARLREEREREQRAIEDFRQKLLAEAKASNDSELMLRYLSKIQEQLLVSEASLAQPSRDWLELARRIAELTNPESRRIKRLVGGAELDSYGSSFGRTLV